VVYVTGSSESGDPPATVSWNHEGREPGNDDVGFLKALAAFIHENYHTDPESCFIAGFSNGAFMCHRLALEASDTFSAVISVAGTMPENVWKSRPDVCSTSLLQIAGEKDNVIPKLSDGSARYSAFPAIEDVIGYYSSANGLDEMSVRELGRSSKLTEYRSKNSANQVWFLYVIDGRHSWSAESVTGIDTNNLIINFLESVKNH
jgi:poly(3-hydroxybutyrate) depolymerase